jgi:hypothetical protein
LPLAIAAVLAIAAGGVLWGTLAGHSPKLAARGSERGLPDTETPPSTAKAKPKTEATKTEASKAHVIRVVTGSLSSTCRLRLDATVLKQQAPCRFEIPRGKWAQLDVKAKGHTAFSTAWKVTAERTLSLAGIDNALVEARTAKQRAKAPVRQTRVRETSAKVASTKRSTDVRSKKRRSHKRKKRARLPTDNIDPWAQ